MKYLAAALLLALGKQEINEANMKKVLESAGAKVDAGIVKKVCDACKGKKDITAFLKEGLKKMEGMSVGGGEAHEESSKKDDKKGGKDDKKKGGKKEEKKEVKKEEEEDDDMDIGGLF